MIIAFAAVSAAAAAISLVFDIIVIRWHLEERKRFAEDEQRMTENEERWAGPEHFAAGGLIEMADDGVHQPFGFAPVIMARKQA